MLFPWQCKHIMHTISPMKQKSSILAIDRGKKYIGCAYALEGSTIVFPIGYIINDAGVFAALSEQIVRYRVKHIVIGVPSNERAQKEIAHFQSGLAKAIDDAITIEQFDENYTSVQAGERVSNYQKSSAEDTVAAMVILENYLESLGNK